MRRSPWVARGTRGASLSLSLILVFVLSASSGRTAVAIGSSRAVMTGTTTVTFDRSGSTSIELPTDAAIRISGYGFSESATPKIIAAALVAEDEARNASPTGAFWVGGRLSWCEALPCSPETVKNFAFQRGGTTRPLEAGNYRLVTVSDDGPTTIVLEASGLGGRSSLSAGDFNGFDFSTIPLQESFSQGRHVAWGGETFSSGSHGIGVATWGLVPRKPTSKAQLGVCSYAVAPPHEAAYGPACSRNPAAGAGATATRRLEGPLSYTFLFRYRSDSWPPNATGTRGIGGWIDSPKRLRMTSLNIFVISFPQG